MMKHMNLSNEELKNVAGGLSSLAIVGITVGVVFGIGVIDGFARPPKCRA